MKIGLISDTHHFLDPQVFDHFKDCDEIWHAGDFGTLQIAEELRQIAPVVGVFGNIDGFDVRSEFPQTMDFEREGFRIMMTHIGGNCGRYALTVRGAIESRPPDIFICGHSHILKIARDKNCGNMIFINPGAAGRQGFHHMRTIVTFQLKDRRIFDMQVINLGLRVENEEDELLVPGAQA
jgi:putative phosphoesterase